MTAADSAKVPLISPEDWRVAERALRYQLTTEDTERVAAALAAARADADAHWKAAVEGLAESAPHTDACLDRLDATRGTCTCDRPIPAARLRGLATGNSEEGTA